MGYNSSQKTYKDGLASLEKWLFQQDGHFAVIIKEGNKLFLATDKVSSFTLFYCDYNKSKVEVSSSSSSWIDKDTINDKVQKMLKYIKWLATQ